MLFGRKTKQQEQLESNEPNEMLTETMEDGSAMEQPAEQTQDAAQEDTQTQEEPNQPEETQSQTESTVPEEENQTMRESDLTASISRDTVIHGDVESKDNIDVFGTIEGSIKCSAVVKAYGSIHGDINCSVLVANGAEITGNINSEKSVVLGNDTTVKGDIQTGVINISGQVNGNITVNESTTVSSSGCVYGDIATPVIEVCKGAIVFGSVVMDPKESASDNKSQSSNAKKSTVTELSFQEIDEKKSNKSNLA